MRRIPHGTIQHSRTAFYPRDILKNVELIASIRVETLASRPEYPCICHQSVINLSTKNLLHVVTLRYFVRQLGVALCSHAPLKR